MLNRLMFVYFIQRKGFLDGDRDYLRNRLNRYAQGAWPRQVLLVLPLFPAAPLPRRAWAGATRSADLEKLLGRIPYLNGGLFDVHELEQPERYGENIQIPDKAFERIFDYFDQYQWHLDERPLRADNEINPDVLGYIFEKYINQKQMGAYYTKEDITEYISKNTVLPFLFDAARGQVQGRFRESQRPDRLGSAARTTRTATFIPPSGMASHGAMIQRMLNKGTAGTLRSAGEIAAGLNPRRCISRLAKHRSDAELRKGWNKPAPPTSHCRPRPGARSSPAASVTTRSAPSSPLARSATSTTSSRSISTSASSRRT